MRNEEIAKRLARLCYKPKGEKSDDFATQLFVESLVLSDDCSSYTEQEIFGFILEFLEYSSINKELNKVKGTKFYTEDEMKDIINLD